MSNSRFRIDKNVEQAVHELLKSRAESRIYLFLLIKQKARSEDIIKGTNLHPSTVRELLSRMYDQKLISRKKLRNENIGKNPYVYQAVPPVVLLQRKARELEERLNKLAHLSDKSEESTRVQIKIYKEGDT